jgi:hypothetical protein
MTIIISNSCNKDEPPESKPDLNDLFPLKVGNIFYYTLKDKYDKFLLGHYTDGIEKWTIISITSNEDNNNYSIERKLNGIFVNWNNVDWNNPICDTTIIKDSIRYFSINENQSTSIMSFWNITLKRYQSTPDTIIRWWGYNQDNNASYYFNEGRGLTEYYYSEGLMISQTRVSLILDSLKTIQ